jgi:type IV pilus assembly protein PilO
MTTALETLKGLTGKQKILASTLILMLISGAFVWFIFIPYSDEISQLQGTISSLTKDVNVHQIKTRHLEELKRENQELQRTLAKLREQFPPEAEVEIFLKQVSELGEKTGLDFKLWKPNEKKRHPSGLYTEVPVAVEVAGEYHALGLFFDKINKLPRIINWSNLKMGSTKIDEGRVLIQTGFLATAFAAAEDAPPPPKKGGAAP